MNVCNVSVCVYLNVSVWYVCVSACECVCEHMYGMSVYVYVFVCLYLCESVCVNVCIVCCLCICKCVCDCVCVYRGNTDHFRKVNKLVKFLLPNNSLYDFIFLSNTF